MSLHTELKTLFDQDTIRRSQEVELGRVDALAVHAAAGALLRLKGKPEKQVELVQRLQPATAAALCRWLADPAFWGVVGGISRH